MIALHARRSAEAIAAWHARHGDQRLALVLTGTDLYRDIAEDAAAQRSLALAGRIVVLQSCGIAGLPDTCRSKAQVIYQSAPIRQSLPKSAYRLRAVMVGHLRSEKSPETLFAAARHLVDHTDIFIDHIGAALDPALGDAAQATMAVCPNYRWLGALTHAETRRRIQRAHLLIHASHMEGGAHVIIEAIQSGTPVLASRVDGNVGMLGEDYGGYFPWNDAESLARQLITCRASPALLDELWQQCRRRAALFSPAAEAQAVQVLGRDLLG